MSREALIVGINIYDCAKDLQAPVKDAEAIASHLEKHGDFRLKCRKRVKHYQSYRVDRCTTHCIEVDGCC